MGKTLTMQPGGLMQSILERIDNGDGSLDDFAQVSRFDVSEGQRLNLLGIVVMSELARGWKVVLPNPWHKGAK